MVTVWSPIMQVVAAPPQPRTHTTAPCELYPNGRPRAPGSVLDLDKMSTSIGYYAIMSHLPKSKSKSKPASAAAREGGGGGSAEEEQGTCAVLWERQRARRSVRAAPERLGAAQRAVPLAAVWPNRDTRVGRMCIQKQKQFERVQVSVVCVC